jgi:hypothetical protein
MAKARKLTVKIFESRQILNPYTRKDSERFFKKDEDLKFWPLYLTISYNNKTKNMKSPTFEFLERMGYGYNLIFGDHELIRLNDERLLKNFKRLIEESNREFSLDLVSPANEEFNLCKKFIYDYYSSKARRDIFKVLIKGLERTGELRFPNSMLILAGTENLHDFLGMIKELSPKLFEEFTLEFTDSFSVLTNLDLLKYKNIFPFWVDHLVNEDFLKRISSRINDLETQNKTLIEN